MVEALRLAKDISDDFGNGAPFVAPKNFFRFAVELTEKSYRPDGIYSDEQPPLPVCNGDGAELDLAFAGAHLNFTMALPKKEQHTIPTPRVSPSEIFDKLFLRQGVMIPEDHLGLNFLCVSWINFFFEDTLRTKNNTNGATRLDASTSINSLATVYGRNKRREFILRSFENGKLRTSLNDQGEEVALMWVDVEEEEAANSTDREAWQQYVLGDDQLNTHWGHIFWHTIYLKEHNRICDTLAASNPTFSDERLFRMARVIMTHLNARIFLENFASDVVLRANKIHTRLRADISFCASPEYADLRRREAQLPLEYLHAYTFHELISDELRYGIQQKSLVAEIFRKPDDFEIHTIQDHFDAFYQSASGAFAIKNVPWYLKGVTIRQIEQSRQNKVASYVDYNRYFGGAPIHSFEDLRHDDATKAILKELYSSVEEIDAYVGIQSEASFLADNHDDSRPLVRTSLILSNVIPNFIATSCYKDTALYTAEFLTEEGLDMINSPPDALVHILQSHVDLEDNTPFTRFKDERVYKPEQSLSDLRLQNLGDFVGLNELWHHSLRNLPEFQWSFLAVVLAGMIYVALASIVSPLLRRCAIAGYFGHEAVPRKLEDRLTVHYAITFLVLALQIPVYTALMVFMMFTERQDLAIEKLWFATILNASLHFVLYIADIAVRQMPQWYLVAHHLLWFTFFLLPLALQDIFAMRVGLVLDYFTVFEAGLYWLLFWSKVKSRELSSRCRSFGRWSVYMFAGTRALQLIALVYLFTAGFSRMSRYGHLGLYVALLLLTVAVLVSQTQVLFYFKSWNDLWNCDGQKDEAWLVGKDGGATFNVRTSLGGEEHWEPTATSDLSRTKGQSGFADQSGFTDIEI